MELDEYINLEARVKGRMVLLDVSATGEENIIDTNSKQMNDLEYRKKQLESLQEEVIDLEDIKGSVSFTDLTFNDFRMDLYEYVKTSDLSLDRVPTGIHSVVDRKELNNEIEPGVIFCLKQVTTKVKVEEGNSLYPYCLVFIQDNGVVKEGYLHPKKNLDLLRKLCSGKKDVLTDLVTIFNKETKEGFNMSSYSELLEDAIKNITGKEEEQGMASLFTKGGTNIAGFNKSSNDFELITFLVIK